MTPDPLCAGKIDLSKLSEGIKQTGAVPQEDDQLHKMSTDSTEIWGSNKGVFSSKMHLEDSMLDDLNDFMLDDMPSECAQRAVRLHECGRLWCCCGCVQGVCRCMSLLL